MKRILIIDDDEPLADLSARYLIGRGYRAAAFYDGLAGLAAFIDDPDSYALIFTDIAMPGLSGVEVMMRAREVRPTVPVILISGFPIDRSVPFFADASGTLTKPINLAEMGRMVDGILC